TPVVPLTIGFRVPEAVLALANRLLPALGVAVPEARSLRRDGWLRIARVEDLVRGTVAEVLTALEQDGSVGVIAADSAVPRLTAALREAGVDVGTAEEEERVTVLPASLAKGLEYDHVIGVEPA